MCVHIPPKTVLRSLVGRDIWNALFCLNFREFKILDFGYSNTILVMCQKTNGKYFIFCKHFQFIHTKLLPNITLKKADLTVQCVLCGLNWRIQLKHTKFVIMLHHWPRAFHGIFMYFHHSFFCIMMEVNKDGLCLFDLNIDLLVERNKAWNLSSFCLRR